MARPASSVSFGKSATSEKRRFGLYGRLAQGLPDVAITELGGVFNPCKPVIHCMWSTMNDEAGISRMNQRMPQATFEAVL